MAHLRQTSGSMAGARYPLDADQVIIGRHSSCDIVTENNAVSRRHAQITLRDNGHYIEDLNSRNGTFVNEQWAIGPRRLQCDDIVRICDLTYVFHDEVSDDIIGDSQMYLASKTGAATAVELLDDDGASQIRRTLDVSSGNYSKHDAVGADVKLQALLNLSANLGASVGVMPVLDSVLDTLFEVFPQADRGIVVFRGPNDSLIPKAAKMRQGDRVSVRISRTIVEYVMNERQAIVSRDATDDSRFDMAQSIASLQIRSLMCAPLLSSEGDVLGAVHIDTLDADEAFDDADLELLWAVAAQACLAIQNAQLLETKLEQRALQRDLELAQQVQMGLLPQSRPSAEGYDFFDYYNAAHHIGGDYYDYVKLPNGRVAIIVADVTGHGAAAALLMTKLAGEARFCLATLDDPSEVICRLNRLLCDDGVEDRFVTMVMAVLDLANGVATVVNAGHFPPRCITAAGEVRDLAPEVGGLPLGVNEDWEYTQAEVQMEKGSVMVLYTDGIVEAMNADGEQFNDVRWSDCLSKDCRSLDEYGSSLIDSVRRFSGQEPQSDDICLVCVRRR